MGVEGPAEAAAPPPSHGLMFLARPRTRLRVSFTLRDEDDTRIVWWSDAPDDERSQASSESSTIDEELRRAQEEMADAELFTIVRSQDRSCSATQLTALQLVRETRALHTSASMLSSVSASSVTLSVTPRVEMCFELVRAAALHPGPSARLTRWLLRCQSRTVLPPTSHRPIARSSRCRPARKSNKTASRLHSRAWYLPIFVWA